MSKIQKQKGALPDWQSVLMAPFLWIEAVFFTVFFSLLGLIAVLPASLLFERKRRSWMHQVAVMWARAIVAFVPLWKFNVQGQENIQPGKTYVVVANHQSMLDILLVLSGLPLHFKFMAKEELFKIPFIGWHMRMAGYIPIDRESRESAKKAIECAKERLSAGASVLFFPEGTRSLDGQVKDFKAGAFRIARELKIDILPVIIDGTGDALPKKSWRLNHASHFHLVIEKPVSMQDESLDAAAAKEHVRHQILQRLEDIRKK